MTTDSLNELRSLVKQLAGNQYLYFDTAVDISSTDFDCTGLWAVCVSPSEELYVMDSESYWHSVGAKDQRVVSLLLPKVQAMHKIFCK